MSERDAVEAVEHPNTVDSLVSDLRDLGIERGETLLVHSSLRALGWVAGGAQAVVDALQQAVTPAGTLVVPTFTSQYSDPADWSNPPVPAEWVQRIPDAMPPFRPEVTPTRGVGVVPECFRTYPATVRSRHPEYSFGAWGADAGAIVADHSYDRGLGDDSPLAALEAREARVLLLGVGHEVNTSLHLAEHRAAVPSSKTSHRAPVLEDGERVCVEYSDIELRTDDFEAVGDAFERHHDVVTGQVGVAEATLLDQRPLVEFAASWFEANRSDPSQ